MKKRVLDLAVGDLVLSSAGYTWRVVEVIGWRNLTKYGRGREYLLLVQYSGMGDTTLMRSRDTDHEVEIATEEVSVADVWQRYDLWHKAISEGEETIKRARRHREHVHVTFDPKQLGGEHEVSQP